MERTNSGGWDTRNSEVGYTYQAPTNWVSSEEQEGRYKRTYVRASIRGVFVLLKSTERSSFSAARPIDWHGMEKDLRKRYGKAGYKRLFMTRGTLLNWPAGLWEYEVEKPSSPRLRKLHLGYAEGWNSHVVACTAPAQDWKLWQPVLEQFVKELRL